MAAVRVGSRVAAGSGVISRMVRSTLPKSPRSASFLIWPKRSMSTSFRHRPPRVPPPMPLPQRCRTPRPRSAKRKAVPVPMVATTARSWPDMARAPVPLAENSSTLQVGRP